MKIQKKFSATEHGYMHHVTSHVLRYARFYDINKYDLFLLRL